MRPWNAWKNSELIILQMRYGKLPVKALAKVLHRSAYAIQWKACELGLESSISKWQTSDTAWAPLELTFVRDNYRKLPAREIASRLNRTATSIYQMAFSMGLTSSWTPSQKKTPSQRKQLNLSRTPAWRTWRRAVYTRDRHICVMCRIPRSQNRKHKYDPHHIVKKSVRPDLMFVVDNGVTLCRPCHNSIFCREELYAPQFIAYIAALRGVATGVTI